VVKFFGLSYEDVLALPADVYEQALAMIRESLEQQD
jgi:hypothetical protein